jgi:hypothetical protein
MTSAIDVYNLLSRTVEGEPRPAPANPARAFGRIGIGAVAGALAASRPEPRDRRPGLELPPARILASTWR